MDVIVRKAVINGHREAKGLWIAVVDRDSNPLPLGNCQQFPVDWSERAILKDRVNRALHLSVLLTYESCDSGIVPQQIDLRQIVGLSSPLWVVSKPCKDLSVRKSTSQERSES
jgi:hypothetical protein